MITNHLNSKSRQSLREARSYWNIPKSPPFLGGGVVDEPVVFGGAEHVAKRP